MAQRQTDYVETWQSFRLSAERDSERDNLFADRLMERVRTFSPLCVGIDPHPSMFPELFGKPSAGAIAVWADGIIEAAASQVACIKPQAAFFEAWGSPGMAALEHVCKTAHNAGLIVLLDAKRGDIGSTAQGYADAYLGENAVVANDALTVIPFMGLRRWTRSSTRQKTMDAALLF